MATEAGLTLAEFNRLPPSAAAEFLASCCRSEPWIADMVAARPHDSVSAVRTLSAGLLAELAWPDILQALAAHSAIGRPPTGADREARLARHEQTASETASVSVRDELVLANADYQRRFGHVFLIRAAGRGAEEILRELRRRLANAESAERTETRRELAEIVALRLAGAFR